MGLDPQGYGNPDFCWLSLRDTLIWSFAGPIGTVIVVSAQNPRFSGAWGAGCPSRELSGVESPWVTGSTGHPDETGGAGLLVMQLRPQTRRFQALAGVHVHADHSASAPSRLLHPHPRPKMRAEDPQKPLACEGVL